MEAWVELQAVDANNNVIAHYGGPDTTTGILPSTAARLGSDLANAQGTLLSEHQLSQGVSIPFDRRVPAGGQVSLTLTAPATLPAGATALDAVLLYRNVRTTYYQAAVGSTTASVTAIQMARTPVP